MVESQPSKLLVAGSIPVSRSMKTVTGDKWRVTSKRVLAARHLSLFTCHCTYGPM